MALKQSQVKTIVDQIGQSIDREEGPHLYRQIKTLLRASVQQGTLQPGDSLPSQRELSTLWRVGEVTVRRALQDLATEGLIEARPGAGTIIRDPAQRAVRQGGSQAKRPLTVGIAFTNLADGYPFFRPVLQGLREAEEPVAVRLFELPASSPGSMGGDSLDHAPLSELDGLILMSPVHLALLAQAQARKLPTVLLFSDLADGFSHCLTPNYSTGVIQAVEHLVHKGRRRIALITAGQERYSTGRWLESYHAACQAFHLDSRPEWHVEAGYNEREGAAALRQLLTLPERPDAVICASDFTARGALLAAHEARLVVPTDLAIVGAGPLLDDDGWTVPLASIDLGLVEMGQSARKILQAARAGDAQSAGLPRRHTLPTRFRPGQTA